VVVTLLKGALNVNKQPTRAVNLRTPTPLRDLCGTLLRFPDADAGCLWTAGSTPPCPGAGVLDDSRTVRAGERSFRHPRTRVTTDKRSCGCGFRKIAGVGRGGRRKSRAASWRHPLLTPAPRCRRHLRALQPVGDPPCDLPGQENAGVPVSAWARPHKRDPAALLGAKLRILKRKKFQQRLGLGR